MKKVYTILLLFLFLKTAAGQVEKPVTMGHFLAGGSVAYSSKTSKQSLYIDNPAPGRYVLFTTKEDVFQPDLIFGYYPLNHLALGLLANAETYVSKTKDDVYPDFYRYRYSTFGLGPFIRFSTGFGVFIQGSASFGFNKHYNQSVVEKWKSHTYSIGGGYSFFIKDLISIEPSLNYKYTSVASHGVDNEIKTNGVFFSLGSYIYFDLTKTK